MAEYFAGGHLRFVNGKWQDDDGNVVEISRVRHGKWILTKEHLWYKDENGEIDEFRYESGFCNGPVCKICGEAICMHCNPNWKESECLYGYYKCSKCGNSSEEGKEKYCSSCGAIMIYSSTKRSD